MTILYADDDSDDRVLVSEVFKEIDPSISCITVCDGRQAIDILHKAAQLPDCILLDINMPVMNGLECLVVLKNDDRFKSIPVIVYSTTSNAAEISRCHKLGASLFVRKPHSSQQLHTTLSEILK
jgi:CheY-like chemotaxis protein